MDRQNNSETGTKKSAATCSPYSMSDSVRLKENRNKAKPPGSKNMCPRGSGTGQDYHPSSAWCPVTQNLPANQQPLCILPLMRAPCLSIHSGSMAAFTVCASTTHCKHSGDSLHFPVSLCENKHYSLINYTLGFVVVVLVFCLFETGFPCIPGCPQAHYGAKDGLELLILLPLHPK